MTKEQIKIAYSVMLELEKEANSSTHNPIIVVKNVLANKLMQIELSNE